MFYSSYKILSPVFTNEYFGSMSHGVRWGNLADIQRIIGHWRFQFIRPYVDQALCWQTNFAGNLRVWQTVWNCSVSLFNHFVSIFFKHPIYDVLTTQMTVESNLWAKFRFRYVDTFWAFWKCKLRPDWLLILNWACFQVSFCLITTDGLAVFETTRWANFRSRPWKKNIRSAMAWAINNIPNPKYCGET